MTTTKAPPGPVAHHGAGIGDAFNQDPLDFLTTCSREYGDIALLQFDRPVYLLNRADLVERVLVDKLGLFAKEILPSDLPGGRNPQTLKYEAFRGILGQNVLTADGDDWRRRRRVLAPPFHYQPTLSYIPTIVDRTARLVSRWSDGEVLEIREQMMELTLGVVSSALMGVDISTDAREEGLAFRAALDHFYKPSSSTQPFEQALAQLHEAADAIIQERRAAPPSNDLLSLLVHAEGGQHGFSDEDLRNELLTFLFAGHETTANGLAWTLALLTKYPDAGERLLREVQAELGGRAPTCDDLPRLSYAQMVVQESLRLFPPVWFLGRFLNRDWQVDTYELETGSGVLVSQWVIQRDRRYFDRPEAFDPERWTDDLERRLPRGAYFPFGDGPRVCIGRPLALMEMALVVATILQTFELTLTPGQELVPEAMNTIRPKGGLNLQIHRR